MGNNIDINELMKMLSKMDKKDLEKGIAQASQILNSNNAKDALNNFNNKQNN